MVLFGDILPFLQENDISPATRGKLIDIFSNPQRKPYLMVELAVVIDIGEHFVKATYSLEGDGPLAFSCFEVLFTVNVAITSPLHLPNTEALVRQLSAGSSATVIQWM